MGRFLSILLSFVCFQVISSIISSLNAFVVYYRPIVPGSRVGHNKYIETLS